MIIDAKFNKFIISFKYDPERVLAVKSLPERRYDKEKRFWVVPVAYKREVLAFGTANGFTFTTNAKNIIEDRSGTSVAATSPQEKAVVSAVQASLEAITPKLPDLNSIEVDVTIRDKTKKPFDHQVELVKLALHYRRCIIAADMGLGKTMTALIAAKNIGVDTIVVCPASLIDNWYRESEMVGIELKGVWSFGKMPEEWPGQYTLIADEAHAFQNEASKRGKKFLKLAEKAEAVLALTGTPIKNGRPINVMPLLIACRHETVKDKSFYQIHFCNARKTPWSKWDCNGAKNLTELHARTKDVIFRKTKEQCLNLPEKLRQRTRVEYADKTRYNEEMNELIRQFNIDVPDPMAMSRQQAMGFMMKARRLSSIQKVAGTCEIIDEILEEGGKVVVFTAFVDSAKMLAEQYKNQSILFTGATDVSIRQSLVDRFQQDPKIRVFVSTFGAGGVGITLTQSRNVILMDRTFVPADADQAESRCHRIGTTGTVVSTWVQIDDLDERIDKVIESKEENIELILEGKRKTVKRTSPESIAMAFLPSILNAR